MTYEMKILQMEGIQYRPVLLQNNNVAIPPRQVLGVHLILLQKEYETTSQDTDGKAKSTETKLI